MFRFKIQINEIKKLELHENQDDLKQLLRSVSKLLHVHRLGYLLCSSRVLYRFRFKVMLAETSKFCSHAKPRTMRSVMGGNMNVILRNSESVKRLALGAVPADDAYCQARHRELHG